MKGLVPFDKAAFEDAILLAMGLGIPDDPDQRPTFVLPGTTSATPSGTSVDAEGMPFDPSIKAPKAPGKPVQVRCAVEFLDRQGEVLDFGIAQADSARLTLLDAQYQLIKGFTHVLLGGTPYAFRETGPPLALADATIWQVLVTTEDET